MNKIAILMASARSEGNTRKVISHLMGQIEADLYDLNDYEVGYYDYEHRQSDDFPKLMQALVGYDYLILATPVYWYSMSAQMKTFFDRLTDLFEIHKPLYDSWAGKTWLTLSCGPDDDVPEFFAKPFAASADYLNLNFAGWVHTWLEKGDLSAERKQAVKAWLKEAGLKE
ncbi:MAG: NAD(P)H-dependent oxidoreductase [Bacteroidota bacterium]